MGQIAVKKTTFVILIDFSYAVGQRSLIRLRVTNPKVFDLSNVSITCLTVDRYHITSLSIVVTKRL